MSLTRALAKAIEDIDAEQNPPAVDDAAPAWQAPDYIGPLDIEQAGWRNRNIKPVGTLPSLAPQAKCHTAIRPNGLPIPVFLP